MTRIETLALAHRYLYYVECLPVISDQEYDKLEKEALATVGPDSLLNQPGSDKSEDYPEHVVSLAEFILNSS